jgi:hypothetical protein
VSALTRSGTLQVGVGGCCRLLQPARHQASVAVDHAAASRGIEALEADVLRGNQDMLLVFRERGTCTTTTQDGVVHVVMPVQGTVLS